MCVCPEHREPITVPEKGVTRFLWQGFRCLCIRYEFHLCLKIYFIQMEKESISSMTKAGVIRIFFLEMVQIETVIIFVSFRISSSLGSIYIVTRPTCLRGSSRD